MASTIQIPMEPLSAPWDGNTHTQTHVLSPAISSNTTSQSPFATARPCLNGLASLNYMTPWNLGVPPDTLSGLEKFEAPDPAD
ncbi:hypothetical protein Cob_v009978 [Colletotrichum orbiculare MAFF 240422]|uniref:Uncharacterized protein n=1 Tax=Colletotrichum orbiculare (strain 104-T / ATCC 96160 / CBS 514.97 / LARS 414 / MAFF 240422) TaxID=1213857 RepID=A0A484FH43_COLOR|nr:hypothetical protein Cob_v009978 [Colletotrichum orbiculare MAFF 240422]